MSEKTQLDPNYQLLTQIKGIRNLIAFKKALLQLTTDEIKQAEADIVFLQGKADETAQIVSKDEIENKAAETGQH